MNLKQYYLTKNECYISGKKHNVKGILVHSTGANNPNLRRYVGPDDGLLGVNQYGNHWNQPRPDGQQICVHAFVGKLADGSIATYQTLPWDIVGWHSGSGSKGSSGNANNNGYIGFEICEDALTDSVYFNKVYQEAVELCAYLCKTYNIKPESPYLICHSEGNALGIASAHADVMHWWPKHGKSMDTFRAAVKAAMAADAATGATDTANSGTGQSATAQYRVRKTWSDAASQLGAFAQLSNAKALADKNPGYAVFDSSGKQVYPEIASGSTDIGVGDIVAIKNGTAKYYPGSVAIPDWAILNQYHKVTQTTSAGKPVTKGGVTCVLLGKKIDKTRFSESDGINTWIDKNALTIIRKG